MNYHANWFGELETLLYTLPRNKTNRKRYTQPARSRTALNTLAPLLETKPPWVPLTLVYALTRWAIVEGSGDECTMFDYNIADLAREHTTLSTAFTERLISRTTPTELTYIDTVITALAKKKIAPCYARLGNELTQLSSRFTPNMYGLTIADNVRGQWLNTGT